VKGDVIFLDKDGTLIENRPYNVDPTLIQFTRGALVGLRRLQEKGYLFIVISNQAGVAKGLFAEEALTFVEKRIRDMLAQAGVPLTGFYYCPHHPDGKIRRYAVNCACRKPMPGLLFRAAHDHDIRLKHSWFIGDTLDDVEAGRRAGCKTLLLNNGHETQWRWSTSRVPHVVARNLAFAAEIIITSEKREATVCA
jgi:histidinol-phosphate phosphatase family protein